MSRFLVEHDGKFLEWSTIVDAPLTNFMSMKDLFKYWRAEYGRNGVRDLDQKLRECKKLKDIKINRAGDNEQSLSESELVERYS